MYYYARVLLVQTNHEAKYNYKSVTTKIQQLLLTKTPATKVMVMGPN